MGRLSFISHTAPAEKKQKSEKEVQEAFPELEITRMDPLALSIVCHTGPGVLAIAGSHCVRRKKRVNYYKKYFLSIDKIRACMVNLRSMPHKEV